MLGLVGHDGIVGLAAYPVPPSETTRAVKATTIEEDGPIMVWVYPPRTIGARAVARQRCA